MLAAMSGDVAQSTVDSRRKRLRLVIAVAGVVAIAAWTSIAVVKVRQLGTTTPLTNCTVERLPRPDDADEDTVVQVTGADSTGRYVIGYELALSQPTPQARALLWTDGKLTELDLPDDAGQPIAVDRMGTILGFRAPVAGENRKGLAWLYRSGTVTELPESPEGPQPGTPPGWNGGTIPVAIGPDGAVLGYRNTLVSYGEGSVSLHRPYIWRTPDREPEPLVSADEYSWPFGFDDDGSVLAVQEGPSAHPLIRDTSRLLVWTSGAGEPQLVVGPTELREADLLAGVRGGWLTALHQKDDTLTVWNYRKRGMTHGYPSDPDTDAVMPNANGWVAGTTGTKPQIRIPGGNPFDLPPVDGGGAATAVAVSDDGHLVAGYVKVGEHHVSSPVFWRCS